MNNKIQKEIQRVTNVLDENVEDFEILQYIPTLYTSFPPQTLKKLSEQTKAALQQLFEEEKMLKNKMEERKQSDVVDWSKKVKKTVIRVCQLLKKDNFIQHMVVDELDIRKMQQFVKLMDDMRSVWIDKLNTTEEERQIQNEQKKDTAAREKKANADKKALERELAAEKSSREKELSMREDSVKKYKSDYQQLLQENNQQKTEYNDILESKERAAKQKYEKFRNLITERIQKTKELLAEMKLANMEKEGEMKLRRKNSEKQVEDIINEYDSYMSRTTLRVNTLIKEHKEDNIRIEFLQEELRKCEVDRKEKDEEYQAIVEEKRKVEEARRRRKDAANTIGSFYKRILEKREEQKRLEKAAKKKKGKKGVKKGQKSPAKRRS